MTPSLPDEDLVTAVRAGDRDAFDVLARRHVPRLVGAARAILRDPAAAEDAVADALLKIHGSLAHLRDPRAFAAWAHAIACRAAVDHLRARRRAREVGALPFDACESRDEARLASERLEAAERLARVRRAIDALPEAQRLAVVLHLWEGLSYEQVAEVVGSSYDAVRVNVAHARRTLRSLCERVEGRR
jgi:RNA polymerase sigma-70 factor (ECF subfamily)